MSNVSELEFRDRRRSADRSKRERARQSYYAVLSILINVFPIERVTISTALAENDITNRNRLVAMINVPHKENEYASDVSEQRGVQKNKKMRIIKKGRVYC